MIKLIASAVGTAVGITGIIFGMYLVHLYLDGTPNVAPGHDPVQVLWRIIVVVISFMVTWLFAVLFAKNAADQIFG